MPPGERGQNPADFRRQFLQRIRNQALRDGIPPQRLQQRIAFERLLARLPADGDWVLKGGFALELRYGLQSRPTRDIDLRTEESPVAALDRLRQILAQSTVADRFAFELGAVAREMQGAPQGALRVRVVARLAGLDFVSFHLDLSSGDALVGRPDLLRGSDALQVAGIEPVEFPAYPVVQHLAEKLHAYTLPRDQVNTRVKDLIDVVIVAAIDTVDAGRLRDSIGATFDTRRTHTLPECLPAPPIAWTQSFASIAATVNLPTPGLMEGHQRASRFWDPILVGEVTRGMWSPDHAGWIVPSDPTG